VVLNNDFWGRILAILQQILIFHFDKILHQKLLIFYFNNFEYYTFFVDDHHLSKITKLSEKK
jgi:hypothetical protein